MLAPSHFSDLFFFSFPLPIGTVRRFLEIHGETLEKVVFAVSDLEEVCKVHCLCLQALAVQLCLFFLIAFF